MPGIGDEDDGASRPPIVAEPPLAAMTETGRFLPSRPSARFATIRRPTDRADEAHGSRRSAPTEEQFRAECRAWLEANVPRPALPTGDTREGFAAHLEWERALFDARYAVVSWPEQYGGRDASLWEWLIFEEEYYRAGAPQRVTQNGIFLLAPTIFEFGTPEQQDRILPKMASGEQTWCQGWSEPNAGSDLAGIQSQGGARRRGRRLAALRPEDVDDPRRVLHAPLRPVPQRSRGRAAPRPHVLPRRPRRRRA